MYGNSHVRNFGDMPIRTRTKDSHQPDLGMGVHAHKPLARKTTSFWFYNKAFFTRASKKEKRTQTSNWRDLVAGHVAKIPHI